MILKTWKGCEEYIFNKNTTVLTITGQSRNFKGIFLRLTVSVVTVFSLGATIVPIKLVPGTKFGGPLGVNMAFLPNYFTHWLWKTAYLPIAKHVSWPPGRPSVFAMLSSESRSFTQIIEIQTPHCFKDSLCHIDAGISSSSSRSFDLHCHMTHSLAATVNVCVRLCVCSFYLLTVFVLAQSSIVGLGFALLR